MVARFLFIATVLYLASIFPASSARITVDADGGRYVVTVMGKLLPSDGDDLESAIGTAQGGTVLFASNGGSVLAGVRMGMTIRADHFATAVIDGVQCASACALAWLGGAPRLMGAGAGVGFHAAYTVENGTQSESGTGNAIIGAYVNSLGLPLSVVIYVTSSHPDEMTWLTLDDAREIGIDVALLPPMTSQPPRPRPPEATQTPLPLPSRPAPGMTMEQAARDFVGAYFGRWSENNSSAIAYIEGLYADQVDFYGKPTPRAVIVDLKRKFAERWPERHYVVRPDTLSIDCSSQGAATCNIKGSVDWDCRSTARGAHSAGLADFTVAIKFGAPGSVVVYAESGAVVSRAAPP